MPIQIRRASLADLRRLNDGREFQIYKIFYDPADLTKRLCDLGWHFEIRQTDHYFLYGSGHRLINDNQDTFAE